MEIEIKKCIYFVGPHSTGKTTLANALLEKCVKDTPALQEVARSVLRDKGYTAEDINNIDNCYRMQKDILLEQIKQENELIKLNKKFVSDRAAIDPVVYTKFYIPDKSYESLCNLDEWKEVKARYQDKDQSLIILLEPNEDFLKADGTRKMPTSIKEWQSFSESFSEFLYENDIPFKVIPGSQPNLIERVNQVFEWMNTKMS